MTVRADYRLVRRGNWRIWAHNEMWDSSVWLGIHQTVEKHAWRHHPESVRLKLGDRSEEVFLKIYFPGSPGTALKEVFRASKAIRHWRQSLALVGQGFLAPTVIAAGEQRRFRRIEKAFILTKWTHATSVSTFLRGVGAPRSPQLSRREKREYLRQLGAEIGRMHEVGFVHGDLVLSNVLMEIQERGAVYYFIDHDRTRRYPRWFPQTFWKRNLVQLNRLVLPGITLSDRMRFFRAYASARGRLHGPDVLRLLRWLESKTRRRRLECDGVAGQVSFREFMRWNGPYGDKAGRR